MVTFTPRFGVFPLDHTVYSSLFTEVRFLIIIISYETIILVLCSLKACVIYRQSEPAVTNQLVIFHLRCRIIMFTMCPTGVRFTTEIVVQCCVWSRIHCHRMFTAENDHETKLNAALISKFNWMLTPQLNAHWIRNWQER